MDPTKTVAVAEARSTAEELLERIRNDMVLSEEMKRVLLEVILRPRLVKDPPQIVRIEE